MRNPILELDTRVTVHNLLGAMDLLDWMIEEERKAKVVDFHKIVALKHQLAVSRIELASLHAGISA